MQSLKVVVLTTAFLLFFHSLSSAEMTAVSLQERMRQSDVVVIGMISQSENGKMSPIGKEHWQAKCQIMQVLKGPAILNKTIINIFFIQFSSEFPMPTPLPLKLSLGKKYLLFLKESLSRNESYVNYEMVDDYHGALEAGQDYFIYDEQSPEYPKAVKMSFEEIVRRVAPQPLTLTIQADKQVYEQGEKINITVTVSNIDPKSIVICNSALPYYVDFDIKDSDHGDFRGHTT